MNDNIQGLSHGHAVPRPTGHAGRSAVLYAAAAYFLLAVLLTWPVIVQRDAVVFGDFGDTRGGISGIWQRIHHDSLQKKEPLFAAPFPKNATPPAAQPVLESIFVLPARFLGEIPAYNWVVIFSFALTAFATFLFLRYLLHNNFPAFIGGLIFGFCPAAVLQAVGGHVGYAINVFISLFLLALFYNREKRTVLSALWVGISYALVTLNALYFGYFALFLAGYFIIYDYVTDRNTGCKRLLINYAQAALWAFVWVVPSQYRIIHHILTTRAATLQTTGAIRSYSDLMAFSTRPLDYLTPSIDHPVLGRFFEDFARSLLHGSNLFEQTLYLGFSPLFLCVAGYFLWTGKPCPRRYHRYYLFFITGALLMIFLSLPPAIDFGFIKLPTVSHFMYQIAPMFRVYARFGILVNLFIAGAAAVALTISKHHITPFRYALLSAVLLSALIFEYWSVPPYHANNIATPPAVYQWLAQEPDDTLIAEYPMMNSDVASFYTYPFWQRIHQKKMVNGATPDNRDAWEFFEKVKDLSHRDTPELLRQKGVHYLIVHAKMYQEGNIPDLLKRYYPPSDSAVRYSDGKVPMNPALKNPYKVFGDDIVYSLVRGDN